MKKITRSFLLLFVMLSVMGIACAAGAAKEKKAISEGVKDFNYMTPEEFDEGKFTEGNVFEIYGEFAYMESYRETLGIKHDSQVTSHYYLIPMTGSFESETPLFVALELKSEEAVQNAELLLEQTVNYLESDTEPEAWNEFPIQGKIKRLDSETEDLLYEWLTNDGTDGTRADYEDIICPYIITERSTDTVNGNMTLGVIMTVIGFGAAAAMLIAFVRTRSSSGQAPVSYPAASYTPVNGGSPYESQGSFGNTSSSGNISSPADGGESARLMEEMSRLTQPSDADDFFSKPIRPENPAPADQARPEPAKTDMDGIDTSGLGIGIGDNDK